MTPRNLLVELFVEELPPKSLNKLGEAFASVLCEQLREQGLAGADSVATAFATPRRLAAHVTDVLAQARDSVQSHKLMPVAVGLAPDGAPTPALLKKLAALGANASAVGALERRVDGKSEALFHSSTVRGATLAAGLQKALDAALARLPVPKHMQYQLADGWTSVSFVRPAHGLVALHGAEVVPVRALGLEAGRQTFGHRFEAPMTPVVLQDADHYARQLDEQGAVIAGFAQRRAEIARQLHAAADKEGLVPIDDAALLDEVTALVERPNVLLCRFDAEFLAVPPECLILTMKANQKYFPLLDAAGHLTERFLVVSNIRPADASRVVEGNQRVVRPRLADAKFFFDQDRKQRLEDRVAGLDKVVYHGKLGSQGERVLRVRAIARSVCEALHRPDLMAEVDLAARLAKADLLSDMVGEFPELQGTMGAYYARHDGLPESVAQAIEDHYKPRFAGDALPRGEVGVVVALADKLETLTGLFGVGEKATGDKDPYALRRHALGVIRLLVERDLVLELPKIVRTAASTFGARLPDALATERAALPFVYERIAGYLRDQGFSAQEADAVIASRPPWGEIPRRLAAVREFALLPESASLAAANKRIGNILKKSGGVAQSTLEAGRLVEPAEQSLYSALGAVQPRADAHFDVGNYAASLREWVALKDPVDDFFDGVMVNTDDAALRANRLALLAQLHAAMNRVADLSRLAT